MYREPYGAILPFGLHKGAGLAVVCDLLYVIELETHHYPTGLLFKIYDHGTVANHLC